MLICSLLISKYTKNKWISNLNAVNIWTSIFGCSTQIAHRMSHRRTHEFNKKGKRQFHIPEFVKWLQDHNIILNPEHHKRHHKTDVMYFEWFVFSVFR